MAVSDKDFAEVKEALAEMAKVLAETKAELEAKSAPPEDSFIVETRGEYIERVKAEQIKAED